MTFWIVPMMDDATPGAILGASIYNGTLRNAVLIIGGAGIVMLVVFLLRPMICGGPIVHRQDELLRD